VNHAPSACLPESLLPPSLHLQPVRTRGDWRTFERVPEMLHGDDPSFVPPFPGQVMKLRSPGHPFHLDGAMQAYLARRDGRVVGRIASIVNRTHNDFHGDRTAFFGFFDFTDADTARVLAERAREDLAGGAFDVMRGPFSPTQNDECGLQVAGFGERPYFAMPYTPSSYVEAYEGIGMRGVRDLIAYALDPGLEQAFQARMAGLAERIRARMPIRVRSVDLHRLSEEAALVSRLFNESLADEWNFMPLSPAAAEAFAHDLLGHLDPEAILIAELEGRPVGLSIALPDANEFLARTAGTPRWLRWPHLAWLLKTRTCKRARWAVFAMVPEVRKRGGTVLLVYEAITRGRKRYASGELSWTQDINSDVNRLATELGLEPSKRYRVYEMDL